MGDVVVVNWVTLDGVMQGPGREGEDTRDGFVHSGWAAPYTAPAMSTKIGEVMSGGYSWLLGRHTYEGLLTSWNEQGGPFRDALNDTEKFIASANPDTTLDWPNSTLLTADVPARVAELRASSATTLVIMGSGVLIASLMAAGLIDRYLLFLAPLVLGSGRRLFADDAYAALRLRECTATDAGAVIVSYEPTR